MRGDVVKAVMRLLREQGAMTLQDLVRDTGVPKQTLHKVLRAMQRPTLRPVGPQRIYIHSYVFDQEGQKRYPRAMFALGAYADAPRPVSDEKATQKRYRDKRRAHTTMNSVFNLAKGMRYGNLPLSM